MSTTVLDMAPEELRSAVAAAGLPAYRADQLADWVFRKGVTDPAKMTNLPAGLAEQFPALDSRVERSVVAGDGTVKLLIRLHDGEAIESVWIPDADRSTACLSTQVGCPVGCAFCASGADGLVRNLRGAEILQQLVHLQQAAGQRISNIVFMGTGEPLANYAGTIFALRALTDPKRFGVSARKITVSTVGLPKQIRRLAGEGLAVTLALSLHAPNDGLRRELVPWAAEFGLDEIFAAAGEFYQAHKREITLEYVLLAGVNDTNLCADALARLTRRVRCNVNLIGYNAVPSLPFEAPAPESAERFARRLRERGVNVHVRRSRGADASAACGQLRRGPRDSAKGT